MVPNGPVRGRDFWWMIYPWNRGREKRDLDGSIIINAHCHVLCEGDIITLHVLSTVSLHEKSSLINGSRLTSPLFQIKIILEVIYHYRTLHNTSKPLSTWSLLFNILQKHCSTTTVINGILTSITDWVKHYFWYQRT